MIFYLSQFEHVWSVTEPALRRILRSGAATETYTIEEGSGVRQLRDRIPERSLDRRDGRLPRRFQSAAVVLFPLDQPREWFQEALRYLEAGDLAELRCLSGVWGYDPLPSR